MNNRFWPKRGNKGEVTILLVTDVAILLTKRHGQVSLHGSKESLACQGVYGSAEEPVLHSLKAKNKKLGAFTISGLPDPGGLCVFGRG